MTLKRIKRRCLDCETEFHETEDGSSYRCRCGRFEFRVMMNKSAPVVSKKMTKPEEKTRPRTPREMGEK